MNNHQLGCRRDRLLIDTLQEWGTMDTEQIRIMFFPSLRVAQRRLQRLKDKGKVKRIREMLETPYCYYIKQYSYERMAINWVRLWLSKQLKSWEKINEFDYDNNICRVINTVTCGIKTYNVYYNKDNLTWLDGENVIVVYDDYTSGLKRGKETHKTIDELRRNLEC